MIRQDHHLQLQLQAKETDPGGWKEPFGYNRNACSMKFGRNNDSGKKKKSAASYLTQHPDNTPAKTADLT